MEKHVNRIITLYRVFTLYNVTISYFFCFYANVTQTFHYSFFEFIQKDKDADLRAYK